MSVRDSLCSVCGQGVTLPHQEWCERVGRSLAADPTTWCAVVGCNYVVAHRGLLCDLHTVELEAVAS